MTFFIPIITPRYFEREECRRELLAFEGRARAADLDELLLPILYVDVPGLTEEADDEAMRAVARFQWQDWQELRLEDTVSPAYRRGVNELATRLKEVAAAVVARPVGDLAEEDRGAKLEEAREAIAVAGHHVVDTAEGEELGLVDVLAEAEEALPRMTGILEEMGEVLEEIGRLAEEGTAALEQSNAAGEGFAKRLRIIRDFSTRLDAPSERLLGLSSRYASELRSVDTGFVALIGLAESAETPEDRAAAAEFFDVVREMSRAARETVAMIRDFYETLGGLASYSRDLRRPVQRIQEALQRVMDGQAVMDDWVRRIDRPNGELQHPGPGTTDDHPAQSDH